MLTYLIQTIACSGILYGYYHFFLRNERFHQYNRFYLLAAMFISPILPLFKIPLTISKEEQSPVYAFISTGENIVVTANKGFDFFPFINLLYAIIVAILVSRLIIGILKIVRIKKEAVTEKMEDISFIKTTDLDAPFSFFKWLFWQKNTRLHTPEGAHIFRHEMYHIRSKHTWDLLFIEMLLCVFWFNPFFYLYRKEIKTIQEFLADKHAAKNGDPLTYAELLVVQAISSRSQALLVNPFFNNQLKRRITMLTTTKQPVLQWARKLLVAPVLLLTASFLIIRCQTADEKTDTSPATENVSSSDAKTSNDSQVMDSTPQGSTANNDATDNGTVSDGKNVVEKEPEVFLKVEKEAAYPGNWRSFLERNLNGQVAVDNGAAPGNYTTIIQFIVDVDGNISDVKALTKNGYGLEEEAIRVIKKSGKWKAAIQNGRPVKAYRKQPITFQVTEG